MWNTQDHANYGCGSKVPADCSWRFSGFMLTQNFATTLLSPVTDIYEAVEADGNGWIPGIYSYGCFLCKQRIGAVFSLENGLLK